MMVEIPVNIKDYIIKSRQSGLPDLKIIESLKSANWPEDIITMAISEANTVIQPIDEPVETPENEVQTTIKTDDTKPIDEKIIEEKTKQNNKNLPEKDNLKTTQKKKFCFLTIVALIFSPIPFIGLGFAMTSFDMIKKKKLSGTIIAALALILNLCVIGFVIIIIIQMFTLDASQLEGVSKWLVEIFGIF